MWDLALNLSKYFGVVFSFAFVLEYLVSRKVADTFAEKLIDFSGVIKKENIDASICRFATSIRSRFDTIYGMTYFGVKHFFISSIFVFSYCVIFALLEEHYIGFESSITKQLKFWFIPSLLADICSANFTRWLLGKTVDSPNLYVFHLVMDLVFVLLFFYTSYSVAMFVLYSKFPELGFARIILHPFYMVWFALSFNHSPIVASIKLTVLMALTTLIPTLVHFLFIAFGLFLRHTLSLFTQTSNFFVDRVISYDRHPIAVFTVMLGIFLSPIFIYFQV